MRRTATPGLYSAKLDGTQAEDTIYVRDASDVAEISSALLELLAGGHKLEMRIVVAEP